MFLRIDRQRLEPPRPKDASPDRAAAVQELLGVRFGEASALMTRRAYPLECDNPQILSSRRDRMPRDLIPEESWMTTDTALRDTTTWPDLAIGLYDRLTGRGAE